MIASVWAHLTAPENRETLTWLGGGVTIVAGAIWTVVQRFSKTNAGAKGGAASGPAEPPQVQADRGGIAAGGDVSSNSGNSIRVSSGMSGWQLVAALAVVAGLALVLISQVGGRVSATNGSVGVGGDVKNSTITVGQ